MAAWLRSIYGANATPMRVLDRFALDLTPHLPGLGQRRLLAGVYLTVLVLAAMQALCTALGSGASVAGSARVEPAVSTVHSVGAGTSVRDWSNVQSAAADLVNPDQDHRAGSASMQVGDDLDPDDDGGLTIALAAPHWLVTLPAGMLAPRPEPRLLLGRSEAPPDRPPTSAA
jgi:hypothetical protein